MTPEQRRTIYGHLNDVLPSLKAAVEATGYDELGYWEILRAHGAILGMLGHLQKEMDDASDV